MGTGALPTAKCTFPWKNRLRELAVIAVLHGDKCARTEPSWLALGPNIPPSVQLVGAKWRKGELRATIAGQQRVGLETHGRKWGPW